MKTLATIFFMLVLLAGAYFGWNWYASTDSVYEEVETAAVERQTIQVNIDTAGDLEPAEQVEVKSEVSAKIKRIHAGVGHVVKRGQLLFELDDTELLTEKASALTEIDGARVELEKAKRNFERAESLYKRQLMSVEEYQNKRADYDMAANEFEKSERKRQAVEDKLLKTRIDSPMAGTVLLVPVVEGQVAVGAASVNSGTILMQIANLSRMFISTHVNQMDIARIQKGQKAIVSLESIPDLEMNGRVSLISPMATIVRGIKGFTVGVELEELDPRVRPGMTADLTFPVAKAENALALPLSAIFTLPDDSTAVYLGREKGELPEMRRVEIGLSNFDYAQITDGLDEGDIVLLSRPEKFKEPDGKSSKGKVARKE